jgi:hypothetical protein
MVPDSLGCSRSECSPMADHYSTPKIEAIQFTAIDGTHTKSRYDFSILLLRPINTSKIGYRMMLLIACAIDTHGKVIPLALGLVPIGNELWWAWFLGHLRHRILVLGGKYHVVISDREGGMANAVPAVFDQPIHLHCCQHVADDLQQRYGNKVRPLFWRTCMAKTGELFYEKMEGLGAHYLAILGREFGLGPIQSTLDMATILISSWNH